MQAATPLRDDPSDLAGDLIAARYQIERRIGAGGMGVVYRALDRDTGEPVAVKVLREADPDRVRRFDREAGMLARVDHPGIARYLGHGVTAGGACYIVMEWIAGITLGDRLDRDGLTVAESVAVVRACAEALAAAHQLRIVHRDVKPSNVLLAGGAIEHVKLIDFGLARGDALVDGLTRTGMLVGTPGYMAPEQARGERELDARADVFALGCVLYECVTGVAAFAGEHFRAIQAKLLLGEPAAPATLCPELPARLARLLGGLLAKDRRDRPTDAAEVAAALADLGPLPDQVRRPRQLREAATRRRAPGAAPRDTRCMVLVAPVDGDAPADLADLVAATHELAAAHQGRAVQLADDSLVVLLAGPHAAAVAARAVRLALALRVRLPGALVTVSTSRPDAPASDDSLIDRGVGTLCTEAVEAAVDPDSAALSAVVLDEPTAALLGAEHTLERRGDTYYLRPCAEEIPT